MDTNRPVSAIVLIETHPSVRLYDSRSALLERIGALGLTRQFRVRDDEVSVILDGIRELRVGLEEVSMTSFAGPMDDAFVDVLEAVNEVIAPTAIGLTIGVQHLISMDQDYDAARISVAQNLLGGMVEPTGLTDFAVLFDGVYGDPAIPFQAEFGIVNGDETPLRLGGFAGRLTGRRKSPLIGDLMSREYPEVSMFCDSRWTPRLPDSVGFSTHVGEQLHVISESATNMVNDMRRAISLQSGSEA